MKISVAGVGAVAIAAVLWTRCAMAEDFSAGAVGGIGLARSMSAEIPNGPSAEASVRNSAAAGFFFRDDMYLNVSGEFRYLYRWGAHQVSNDSASARLGAHSHIFHYDLLFHTSPAASAMRPYIAIGAGGRIFQGAGTPPRTQALSNLVLLRKVSETRPMISLGGGMRWRWGGNKIVQFDVRDYMTPTPRKVFAPSATSTVSGWLHDLVPQISLGVAF
jgi:hypothetical protein